MSRSLLIATTGALTLGALVAQAEAQNRTSRAVVAAQADAARAQAGRYGRAAEIDQGAQAPQSPQSDTMGRPNPGRPQFQDPEFRGGEQPNAPADRTGGRADAAQNGQEKVSDGSDDKSDSDGDDNEIEVAEGFFFDNFTSGSGFGVYGGEAVTSGQGQQLNLPSAGVNARNLGLPILPNQPVGTGQPVEPQDPDVD